MPGLDKLVHFVVSFALATIDPLIAVVAGLGKEILDALGAGTPDVLDLLADGLGILSALWLG